MAEKEVTSEVLDETTWSDSRTESCYDTTSDWSMAAAAIPSDSSTPYDEIESGEDKRWRFDTHFTELPENLIPSYECSTLDDSPTQKPAPDSVRWEVAIADAENSNDLYFSFPYPESGDSDSENEELNVLLDALSATGVYGSLGSALGKYYISGSGVTVDNAFDQSSVTWDIPLTGDYEELPQEENSEAKAVQVSTRVNSNYDSGNHSVKFIPEYTIELPRVDQSTCACEPYYVYETTAPGVIGFATYEAKP